MTVKERSIRGVAGRGGIFSDQTPHLFSGRILMRIAVKGATAFAGRSIVLRRAEADHAARATCGPGSDLAGFEDVTTRLDRSELQPGMRLSIRVPQPCG